MRKHRQTRYYDDVVYHATVEQKWGGEVKEKQNWILQNINRIEFLQGLLAESMEENFEDAQNCSLIIKIPTEN